MHYGTGIKKLRELKGMTPREFACNIHITEPTLLQIERKHNSVSINTLEKVRMYLGVSHAIVALLSIKVKEDIPPFIRDEFEALFPEFEAKINHLSKLL